MGGVGKYMWMHANKRCFGRGWQPQPGLPHQAAISLFSPKGSKLLDQARKAGTAEGAYILMTQKLWGIGNVPWFGGLIAIIKSLEFDPEKPLLAFDLGESFFSNEEHVCSILSSKLQNLPRSWITLNDIAQANFPPSCQFEEICYTRNTVLSKFREKLIEITSSNSYMLLSFESYPDLLDGPCRFPPVVAYHPTEQYVLVLDANYGLYWLRCHHLRAM